MILLSIRSHAWEKMAGFFMISSVIFLNVFNGTLEPIATIILLIWPRISVYGCMVRKEWGDEASFRLYSLCEESAHEQTPSHFRVAKIEFHLLLVVINTLVFLPLLRATASMVHLIEYHNQEESKERRYDQIKVVRDRKRVVDQLVRQR